ncbi:unnamed protein product, partial [Gordionus sp. m RMFG-2023]
YNNNNKVITLFNLVFNNCKKSSTDIVNILINNNHLYTINDLKVIDQEISLHHIINPQQIEKIKNIAKNIKDFLLNMQINTNLHIILFNNISENLIYPNNTELGPKILCLLLNLELIQSNIDDESNLKHIDAHDMASSLLKLFKILNKIINDYSTLNSSKLWLKIVDQTSATLIQSCIILLSKFTSNAPIINNELLEVLDEITNKSIFSYNLKQQLLCLRNCISSQNLLEDPFKSLHPPSNILPNTLWIDLSSDIPLIKGGALISLRKLLATDTSLSNSLSNTQCLEDLLEISFMSLNHYDTFVYTAAINVIIQLFLSYPNYAVKKLMKCYILPDHADTKNQESLEIILKTGEIISRIIVDQKVTMLDTTIRAEIYSLLYNLALSSYSFYKNDHNSALVRDILASALSNLAIFIDSCLNNYSVCFEPGILNFRRILEILSYLLSLKIVFEDIRDFKDNLFVLQNACVVICGNIFRLRSKRIKVFHEDNIFSDICDDELIKTLNEILVHKISDIIVEENIKLHIIKVLKDFDLVI